MITYRCACGKTYQVDDDMAGCQLRCVVCGAEGIIHDEGEAHWNKCGCCGDLLPRHFKKCPYCGSNDLLPCDESARVEMPAPSDVVPPSSSPRRKRGAGLVREGWVVVMFVGVLLTVEVILSVREQRPPVFRSSIGLNAIAFLCGLIAWLICRNRSGMVLTAVSAFFFTVMFGPGTSTQRSRYGNDTVPPISLDDQLKAWQERLPKPGDDIGRLLPRDTVIPPSAEAAGEFISEEDAFGARFPVQPARTELATSPYVTAKTHYGADVEGEASYNVFVTTFAQPILSKEAIQAALEGHLQGKRVAATALAADMHMDLVRSERTTFLGHPGVEYEQIFRNKLNPGGDASYVRNIFLVSGRRSYRIGVVCHETQRDRAYARFADFIRSFRLY